MPWSNNNGGGPRSGGPKGSGPWGGGGGGGGGPRNPWGGGPGGPGRGNGGGRGPSGGGGGGQGPNIDEFFRRGQEQLKGALGGGSGRGGSAGILLVLVALAGLWLYASIYIVREGEQAVVLTFGEFTRIDGSGANFAPWPVQTYQIEAVQRERAINIGSENIQSATRSQRAQARDEGLMLTGDENIIDVNFQVVWNVAQVDDFLFNLAQPAATIRSVAEAAMREVVGQSQLQPLLNRDRGALEVAVQEQVQSVLDDYQAGVRIIRVTLDRADPPAEVRESFLAVQAAEQERDTLQNRAQAYFNETTANARGESAAILEQAEAYRARVVAEAQGQAERFNSILTEYAQAPEVTRRRIYLETMERVLGGMNKILVPDAGANGGQGVVQYLPLDQLTRGAPPAPRVTQ